MKISHIYVLFILLLPLAGVRGQDTSNLRPLPDYAIGRLGSADMRLLAPEDLKMAANQMYYDRKQYTEAEKAIRAYLRDNTQSKFAYIALCQLDATYRESEFLKWRNDSSNATDVLFRRGVTSYLHGLSYLLYNPARPKQAVAISRYPEFTDRKSGILPILNQLWLREPDLLNGILLSALQVDLSAPPQTADFLARLIELGVGKRATEFYKAAQNDQWNPTPTTEGFDKSQAEKLCAVLSNEISRQSAGFSGPNNTLVDRQGKTKAVYSTEEQQWLFVQKGTELHYIGEWRRLLKRKFGIP